MNESRADHIKERKSVNAHDLIRPLILEGKAMGKPSCASCAEMKKKLEYEMIHTDYINDMNIEMKEEITRLKDKLKVTVLPTALDNLRAVAIDQDHMIQKLRRVIHAALDLIPDTDQNKREKAELRKMYDRIAS